MAATPIVAAAAGAPPGIEEFNRAVVDATKRMDNAAALALWEEDGVSLLPAAPPLRGRAAIGAFLDRVTAQLPGAKMESFTLECTLIASEGDLAAERCVEHQIVRFPDGRPPFDGRGNILYVLHRSAAGWRIRAEMWNAAEAPKSEPSSK